MARPEKFEDLLEYYRRDEEVADINIGEITQFASPAFAAAAFNLIAIAEAEGYEVTRDGEWKITRPQNASERASSLKSRQQSWDSHKEKYEAAIRGEDMPTYWKNWVINFAKDEGLPIPPSLVEEDEGDDA